MKTFLLGWLIGVLSLPILAFLYIQLGYAPAATAAPPFPLERYLASTALRARISREAPKSVPIAASEENLLAGAKTYREYCAVCHGMSTEPKTAIAKGMYPAPPQLFKGKGVTDDPPGETYWKVRNGIRLTGMPAFGDSLAENQVWQVTLLLATANLPASVSGYLANPALAQ